MFTLGAGSDSTASTIRATLLYIISTPRVYFKLKEVILEAVRKGRASSPIRQAEAKGLPYLQVGPLPRKSDELCKYQLISEHRLFFMRD